jgi:DNA-binding beta-propeller fold protein YncE
MRTTVLVALACGSACKDKLAPPSPAPTAHLATVAPAAPPTPRISRIALPGAGSDGVSLDYLMFDPHTNTVWIPAANTGSVDVVDTATRQVHQIDGFPTKEIQHDGKTRRVGPSSAALGDNVVYIGNRADQSICTVAENTFERGKCTTLNESPDSVTYVATTKEVWVTTPRDNSIRILDASTLAQTARVELPGAPEGFAMDVQSGRFYTNLEDRDTTLVIDVTSHAVVATWKPNCGEAGPRSLRVDGDAGLLFVACTSKVETLSIHNEGQTVGSVDAGAGVDDFAFDVTSHLLYVGAATAGTLTIANIAGDGALAVREVIPTVVGARNGVVDANGVVYLAHGAASELVVVATRAK